MPDTLAEHSYTALGFEMASSTISSLVVFLQEKEFVTSNQLAELSQSLDASALLRELVRREWLTSFQANRSAKEKAMT